MSAKVYRAGWRLFSTLILVLFATGSTVTGDEAKSPSADEKKAVALLSEKGSVIFIDGDYQVTQILGGRDLANDDLQHVRVLKKLNSLSLSNTKINDGAVETLKSLSQLQSLNLPAGAISDQSHETLKKALPNCRIVLPDRRGSGTSGSSFEKSTATPSTRLSAPPTSWGTFEYPPVSPAPSISVEMRSSIVQEHLKLSPEQKNEVDRVTGRDFQRRQTEDAIKKVLTAEQKTLLQQVLLQREGPTALVLPEVAQDLKLTNEQRASVQKLMDDRRQQLMSLGDQLRNRMLDFQKTTQETNRINSEANKQLLAVLTEPQLKAWNAKIGPPLPNTTSGFASSQAPEEFARSTFRNLDRNSDGKLTTEEWHRSRSTRTKFENAKVTLDCPADVEAFVKRYLSLESRKP
ncbi:hypothetical protein LBMAG52_19450 [Planctomycetia bacterium]|nr:hypothetical protein LBMAG52_19450 [Planctomycetia bacterium]